MKNSIACSRFIRSFLPSCEHEQLQIFVFFQEEDRVEEERKVEKERREKEERMEKEIERLKHEVDDAKSEVHCHAIRLEQFKNEHFS